MYIGARGLRNPVKTTSAAAAAAVAESSDPSYIPRNPVKLENTDPAFTQLHDPHHYSYMPHGAPAGPSWTNQPVDRKHMPSSKQYHLMNPSSRLYDD